MPERATPGSRLASLDQFRGYTVAGMLLVNFLGGYAVVPAVLKHHNTYCSYADTIMSQFFFAVGFAARLSYVRRVKSVGVAATRWAFLRRAAALLLLGFALYHLDGRVGSFAELRALGVRGFFATAFRREVFQTLVHIGLATIWVLPVLGASIPVRLAALVGTALLHLGLSAWFYFDYSWRTPVIDGGPLGFISWAIPVLVGTLAHDMVMQTSARGTLLTRLVGWSAILMVVGYGLNGLAGFPAAPPFVPPTGPISLWSMSQRTGSVSYQLFGAGFSLAVYALFVALCDRPRGLDLALFRPFGRNALVAYVLHGLVGAAVKPYVPKDAPAWYLATAFAVYFLINWLFVRGMEKDGTFVRL